MFESQITLEELMSKVSSFDIFTYYCPNFKQLGKPFCSEFRPDKNPSCNIKMWKGDLLYKDFGSGESYRAIDYVIRQHEFIHGVNLGFNEAINKIYNDISSNNYEFGNNNTATTDNSMSNKTSSSIIRIKKRDWSTKDAEYWHGRYNISQETLTKFNVAPISYYWINDYFFEAEELAYCYNYYWEDNIFRRELYQPHSQLHKWHGNGGLVCKGEGMLPRNGPLLIIGKSLKDTMVYYEAGYTCVSPPNEQKWLPEPYFYKQKERFNKLVINFDNDITGIKKSKEFSEKYNIPFILIPESYQDCKDISDVVYRYGFEEATKLLNKLLNELRKN